MIKGLPAYSLAKTLAQDGTPNVGVRVESKLRQPNSLISGAVFGEAKQTDDGRQLLAVNVDGDQLYFEVAGANPGFERLSFDETLWVSSATFQTPKKAAAPQKLTLVDSETGAKHQADVAIAGTVQLHQWIT